MRETRRAACVFRPTCPWGLTMASDAEYRAAADALRRAGSVALTTHVKPDADGLGSTAALRRWLLDAGKTADVIVPTPAPAKYGFLDPDGAVKVAGRDVDLSAIEAPDLVVVSDTATWQQLDGMQPLVAESGAPVLVIDHHRTVDPLADMTLVDIDAAATVVIVHRLLTELGAAIDSLTAGYLFAGLAGDTDWFRLPNVTPETYRLAASLVEAGANPTEIHASMHLSDGLPKLRLWGRAVETLHPALGDRVMVMHLTRAMFRETGADIGDTENLINECMRVRGTRVGVMLVETEGDEVRVSLRCTPGTNILKVAEQFGGGGHIRAAGARDTGPLDQVEARVLAAVENALADAEPSEKP